MLFKSTNFKDQRKISLSRSLSLKCEWAVSVNVALIPPDTHPSHSEWMMIGSSIVRVVMDVNNGNVFIHNCNCTDDEMFVSNILHVTNGFASNPTSHQDLSNLHLFSRH